LQLQTQPPLLLMVMLLLWMPMLLLVGSQSTPPLKQQAGTAQVSRCGGQSAGSAAQVPCSA
jgi:hypothetical protein